MIFFERCPSCDIKTNGFIRKSLRYTTYLTIKVITPLSPDYGNKNSGGKITVLN